jgi:hypothetical protein
VAFVLDYWQLRFNGPAINVMTRIEMRDGKLTAGDADFGFRARMDRQIGKTVDSVTVSDTALTLTFEDRSTILISLRADDYHGPEGVLLLDADRRVCVTL